MTHCPLHSDAASVNISESLPSLRRKLCGIAKLVKRRRRMDVSHGLPPSAFTTQRRNESQTAGVTRSTSEKRACRLAGNQSRHTRVHLQRVCLSSGVSSPAAVIEEIMASNTSFGNLRGIFKVTSQQAFLGSSAR